MEIDVDISAGEVRVISVEATTANKTVVQGMSWLAGWSLRESTGAATASCHFESGGNLVAMVSLASGGADTQWIGGHGVKCRQDITLVIDSGSVEGAVYAVFEKAW